MSDYPPGEFIDPTESPERTKFREKFLSLFSSGEIDVLVNKQFPAGLGVELDEAVALTRASSMAKESENPQIRSWSTCIANTLWYTYQRILEKMNEQERHPNMLYYRPDNESVQKQIGPPQFLN